MKLIIIGVLILTGMYVGTFLAIGVALDTFIKFTPPEQPVLQDIEYSEGQTKIYPDVKLQDAASVQGTVGVE